MAIRKKTRKQLERSKKKRERKESNSKKYQGWAASGKNQKSKRFMLNSKRGRKVSPRNHQAGEGPECGNIGCRRCSLGVPTRAEKIAKAQARRVAR